MAKQTYNENGAILWRGKSALDGSPIVLIATGLKLGSANAKTGNLVQTWILSDTMTPQEAVDSGADFAICGDCPHRGIVVDGKNVGRACYVTIFQAPRNIFSTYKRGRYKNHIASAKELLAGHSIRLGAYGDPAAIPFEVWESMLDMRQSHTGYTHQWKTADSRFSRVCMASADKPQEAQEAQALDYRTFRVGMKADEKRRDLKEFLCPASKEAGVKTNCAACLACGGHSSKNAASVFIPVHGSIAKMNQFGKVAE